MKKALRILSVLMIVCLCVLPFASCGDGIKGDEAKAFVNDFFAAIVAEDYEMAEGMLHPQRPADLKAFLQTVEEKEGIDLQAGIELERYTGISSSYYDSTVDGSTYELTMRTKVGDKTVRFVIEIVKNDAGYGIYNLNIDT